jgi:hypothetical protein
MRGNRFGVSHKICRSAVGREILQRVVRIYSSAAAAVSVPISGVISYRIELQRCTGSPVVSPAGSLILVSFLVQLTARYAPAQQPSCGTTFTQGSFLSVS